MASCTVVLRDWFPGAPVLWHMTSLHFFFAKYSVVWIIPHFYLFISNRHLRCFCFSDCRECCCEGFVQVCVWRVFSFWCARSGYLISEERPDCFPRQLRYFTFPRHLRNQVFHILANSCLFVIPIPVGVTWYVVDLICIFSMANNELLFTCLLGICIYVNFFSVNSSKVKL